ncbi:MAG: hypothetical protein MZW92_65280 [Comamonadaceae bacterium]|nr:hypothetical protein [Comamonadaceae bacterium]
MRRTLFPRLVESYRRWCETGSPAPLLDAKRAGTAYGADAASRLIDLHRKDPANAEAAIEKMLGREPAALALQRFAARCLSDGDVEPSTCRGPQRAPWPRNVHRGRGDSRRCGVAKARDVSPIEHPPFHPLGSIPCASPSRES